MDAVLVTQERLKELFDYDPETGVVTRRITTGPRGIAGQIVGSLTYKGYLATRVDGRFYMLHRLVFVYLYGRHPKHHIDHMNGIKTDNRAANLREATEAENSQNVKAHADSTSGVLGVSLRKATGKWRASIGIDGRHRHLGYFDSVEEAQKAYNAAKRVLHQFQPTVR